MLGCEGYFRLYNDKSNIKDVSLIAYHIRDEALAFQEPKGSCLA